MKNLIICTILLFIQFPGKAQSNSLKEKEETFAWLQYAINDFSSDYVLGYRQKGTSLEINDYETCNCTYSVESETSGRVVGEYVTIERNYSYTFEFGVITEFEKFNSSNDYNFQAVKIRFSGNEVKIASFVRANNSDNPVNETRRENFANFFVKLEIQDRFLKALTHMNKLCKSKSRKVNKNKF